MPELTGATNAKRALRAKLIFNAASGRGEESPRQLFEILAEMQRCNILSEVYMVDADSPVEAVVHDAIRSGIKLIVVSGGDGTIDTVVGAMVGSTATLGIIPTGTRNNVAFNLNISTDIAEAVALLRDGIRKKVDIGMINCAGTSHWFLEAAALGMLSDLYPAADQIQHGDLARIGNLLSTFVSSSPSSLSLVLDGGEAIETSAYMVLIGNMPYIGPRFQISPDVSFNDGYLDVFVFSDMNKLDLITYAVQASGGAVADERIKQYRVKQLTIHSDPPMPVMADGNILEQGPVTIVVRPRTLAVMTGLPGTRVEPNTIYQNTDIAPAPNA